MKNYIVTISALMLMLFASLCLAQPDQRKQARPNIVFILVDDLRWDEIGIAGHPFIKTPNIDRIGKEGAMFRNAFMTTPLCSPSRASFLTGQYAHTSAQEIITGLAKLGDDWGGARPQDDDVTFVVLKRLNLPD